MTLTAHSIIAAAVTKPLAAMNPLLIFIVAIASHYLADAIPHWDYKVASLENDEDKENRRIQYNRRAIIKDVSHFAIDTLVGSVIVILAVRPTTTAQWIWVALAVIGGCLPDFLQGFYALKLKFLRPHQRLHDLFHTNIRLGPYPLVGIPFQAALVIVSLAIFF